MKFKTSKYLFISTALAMLIVVIVVIGVTPVFARSVTTMCHAPGTPEQETIEAYNGEYNIHIAHGDYVGECIPLVNTKPVITRLGDKKIILKVGDIFVDPGITAYDAEDGDITQDVVVGGDIVDTSKKGKYVITYDVMDSDGLSSKQVKRKVRVKKK